MVTSNSFKEISEVLARLESAGTTVQHAEMDQDLPSTDGEVTADLAVTVPILTDENLGEAVSIDAKNAAIEDGAVAVDLTVTVSADRSKHAGGAGRPRENVATTGGKSNVETVPAYKDPDALKAVYEQYSSFPEMTEALGVDVTSETVRRHMIEYEIHDPDDTRPKSYVGSNASRETDDADTGESHDSDTTSTATESPTDSTPNTGVSTMGEQSDGSSEVNDEATTQEATSAVTDGGNVTVDGAINRSPPATTLVKDVVADASTQQCEDPTMRSDINFPETLTVAGLADAINQSQTVHEVTQHIGVNRSAAKQFLQEFGLIDFVSHRLAADQITVSPDEVVRRITATGQ